MTLASRARLLAPTLIALLLTMLALMLLAPSSASAAPPTLTYACDPAPEDCSAWYRSAVDLTWNWDQHSAKPTDGDCTDKNFIADTTGTNVFCEVTDTDTGDYTGRRVLIKIDKTRPTMSIGPSRPPDFAGWFNEPVGWAASGSDATSGIAFCASGIYAGPDGAGVRVTGSCRDVAGNVTTGSFSINYDATPPPAPDVEAIPGNYRVRVRWDGGEQAEVKRVHDGRARVVFRGSAQAFTDKRLDNRQRYRYVVTLIDQAGNRSSDRASAVPTASKLLTPSRNQVLANPPHLRWRAVDGATYYNVQLFRGRRKILSSWPSANELELERRWRFRGRPRLLAAGRRYCWFVWPGLGARSERDYGKALGKSCFRMAQP